MDICGSEIENFDKIVKPITKNQGNGNENLQQGGKRIKGLKLKELKIKIII